jgi:hypothetical protein
MMFRVPGLHDAPIYTCGKMDQVGASQVIPGFTWHCFATWINDRLGLTAEQWLNKNKRISIPELAHIEKTYLNT